VKRDVVCRESSCSQSAENMLPPSLALPLEKTPPSHNPMMKTVSQRDAGYFSLSHKHKIRQCRHLEHFIVVTELRKLKVRFDVNSTFTGLRAHLLQRLSSEECYSIDDAGCKNAVLLTMRGVPLFTFHRHIFHNSGTLFSILRNSQQQKCILRMIFYKLGVLFMKS
jgi:hypothetical protein